MITFRARSFVAVLLTLSAAGMLGGAFGPWASAASAPALGPLRITPASGYDNDLMTFATASTCPAPSTNLVVYISGKGIDPNQAGIVGNSSQSIYESQGGSGYTVPASTTLQQVANEQSPPATLSGRYDVVLECIRPAGAEDYGRFVGSFTIDDRKYKVAASPVAASSTW